MPKLASRLFFISLGGALALSGCGDDDSASSSAATGAGGAGGPAALCKTTAPGATRGSAVAVSPDDAIVVAVNRDAGSVTVISVAYGEGAPTLTKTAEIDVGGEPWQVAVDGCGATAYVALRKDKKVVEIVDLRGTPSKGAEYDVGSEPTALALTPNNQRLYVGNWVDGTLSVVDVTTGKLSAPIDLNPVLAGTGLLGDTVSAQKSRPALAHPRSIAITNDGDADDADEKVLVTEYFAQRTAPESADGKNSDTNKQGLLYAVAVADGAASVVDLAPLYDTGFRDHGGGTTGCFPNQLQSVTINGGFAYVTSICASPVGPLGVFQKGACTSDAQCAGATQGSCKGGSCIGSCTQDSDCGAVGGVCDVASGNVCKPNFSDVKTTTHPVVHVVDTTTLAELPDATTNLNARWRDLYDQSAVADDASRRYPLAANDIAFVPESGVAYVTANGTDAVFRVKYDPATSAIDEIGAGAGKEFINLGPAAFAPENKGQNPIGLAIANASEHPFAFVANDVSRNISVVELPKQLVAGSEASPAVVGTSDLPTEAAAQARLRGKRFFATGLGRWSLRGQGWGSCQSCHTDGLTDNVTWYFARGPRQSTSLDGSFASGDPTDQRIFNWTAIFDEVDDFELNTRGVSGGVGALVSAANNPPQPADRLDLTSAALFPPSGAAGLNGSTEAVTSVNSVLKDWADVTDWIRTIRSPNAPSNLDAKLVADGKSLFEDPSIGGRCQGCHGGAKWTISSRFYTPSGTTNGALATRAWDGAALAEAGFPAALLPATPGNQFMRGSSNAGAADQIQCILRPVGTFGVSPADVASLEVRADMTTPAQGADAEKGNGYNPPSLLNVQSGAPYLHAGNARTLEELFSPTFSAHKDALSQNVNFLEQQGDVDKLVAYLLSIDENTTPIALPSIGAEGGDFCAAP